MTFADWQAYFFDAAQLGDALISGPDADPDGDELSNVLEYLLGGIPLKSDYEQKSPLVSVESNAGQDWLTVTLRVPQSLSDAQVEVEVSGDLVVWRSAAVDVEEVLPAQVNGDGTLTRK